MTTVFAIIDIFSDIGPTTDDVGLRLYTNKEDALKDFIETINEYKKDEYDPMSAIIAQEHIHELDTKGCTRIGNSCYEIRSVVLK